MEDEENHKNEAMKSDGLSQIFKVIFAHGPLLFTYYDMGLAMF